LALGKTVSELQAALKPDEFESWRQFYVRWPFDDLHRYHRPAALVSVSMAGGDIAERLEFLQPEVRKPNDSFSEVDRQVFGALMKLG
jgi:hypothetical protein